MWAARDLSPEWFGHKSIRNNSEDEQRNCPPITKLCAQALSLIPSNEDGWQHQCCSISFSNKAEGHVRSAESTSRRKSMQPILSVHPLHERSKQCTAWKKDRKRWERDQSKILAPHHTPLSSSIMESCSNRLRRAQKHFKSIWGNSRCDCLAVCCCSGVKRLSWRLIRPCFAYRLTDS